MSRDPLRRLERIEYCFAAILALAVLILGMMQRPGPRSESYLVFYADVILKEPRNWIGYVGMFLFLGVSTVASAGAARIRVRWERFATRASYSELVVRMRRVPSRILSLVRLTFPIVLNLILFSYVVGFINGINRNRLVDPAMASFDHSVTGTYVFLNLGMVHFPGWLISTIEFSFANLPLFLAGTALIAYVRDRVLFAKFVVAFFGSIVIMIPIWLTVPVMSPQDRFIDNVYHLSCPSALTESLRSYSPVPGLRDFLTEMRESKEGLDVMPTTTFPSSHAAWATIALIFALEASVAAGSVFAPFLLLSTFGTFYLAQHYFVDAPAGIVVGLISAILASLLFREFPKSTVNSGS